MRNNLNYLLFLIFLIFFSYQTLAQCTVGYGLANDSTLLIKANSKASQNLFFRDHYTDIELGDIYIDISTGLFLHFDNTLDFIKYMDFFMVVDVNSAIKNKHFVTSRVNIEFADHTGFELKSDTLIFATTFHPYHLEVRFFYLNHKSYIYLLNKPIEKIKVIDDVSDKLITLYPAKDEFMQQAECISDFVPKETSVERYSKVMDSLLYTKKYGNMGK